MGTRRRNGLHDRPYVALLVISDVYEVKSKLFLQGKDKGRLATLR